jgi:hypothetical protein
MGRYLLLNLGLKVAAGRLFGFGQPLQADMDPDRQIMLPTVKADKINSCISVDALHFQP